MSQITREELQRRIAEALEQDPQLRERLLADPHGVLSEIAGLSIPDAVKVTVHQESLTDVHLVLPADRTSIDEGDLELVSGGAWVIERCGGCIPCA